MAFDPQKEKDNILLLKFACCGSPCSNKERACSLQAYAPLFPVS